MNRTSKRRRRREADCRALRLALIELVGKCECCGHGPDNPWPDLGYQMSVLCCHEILNAGLRQKTLDEPCTLLVACYFCNQHELHNRTKWPRERQLAALKRSRPDGEFGYNLARFLELRNPNAPLAITKEEVDRWL